MAITHRRVGKKIDPKSVVPTLKRGARRIKVWGCTVDFVKMLAKCSYVRDVWTFQNL